MIVMTNILTTKRGRPTNWKGIRQYMIQMALGGLSITQMINTMGLMSELVEMVM